MKALRQHAGVVTNLFLTRGGAPYWEAHLPNTVVSDTHRKTACGSTRGSTPPLATSIRTARSSGDLLSPTGPELAILGTRLTKV